MENGLINNNKTSGRTKKARINEQIEAKEVRLIGADGAQVGIVAIEDALAAARKAALDLVEIASDSTPIVCKVMNYGKHLFDIKKPKQPPRKNKNSNN